MSNLLLNEVIKKLIRGALAYLIVVSINTRSTFKQKTNYLRTSLKNAPHYFHKYSVIPGNNEY